MSSSEDDGGPPPPAYSQLTQFDGGLDLDDALRKNRGDAFEKRREQRKRQLEERRRQDERRREKLKRGKSKKGDDDASSSGSADLLAEASPLPSPAGSPVPDGRGGSPSPLRTSRISNRARRNHANDASAGGNAKAAEDSPASILRSKKGDPSPNNRVKWRPRYDSSDDEKAPWRPKYDSGSDDDKSKERGGGARRQLLNGTNGNATAAAAAAASPARRKSPWEAHNNDDNAAAKSSPSQRKRPWGDDDSDDDDRLPGGRGNSQSTAAKVTTDRKSAAKVAFARRFGGDSDSSSDDDMEALRRGVRERNKAKAAAAAKAVAAGKAGSPRAFKPVAKSSPPKKPPEESATRPAPSPTAPPKRTRRLLAEDSSDDDDDDFLEVSHRRLQEKKAAEEAMRRAEKEAAKRHNPLDLERREREEMEEARAAEKARRAAHSSQSRSPAKKTPAGAGGLVGTDIVVGDDAEVKSISDMGDSAIKRGVSPGGERSPKKPSRGAYKRRGSKREDDGSGDDEEEGGSPGKRQRQGDRGSSWNQGGGGDMSDDDGLWSDAEEEKKADSDGDGGGKKNRGRGRPRKQNGATQPRKRSQSAKAKADGGSSGDESMDAPKPRKKPAPKKTTRRRSASDSDDDAPKKRSSNGTGRWASLYGNESMDDASASEDERERQGRKLKPEFANPKLGPPAPLVPFVLSRTWRRGDPLISSPGGGQDGGDEGEEDRKPAAAAAEEDDDVDKVPASINRYLQEYQRYGIQFMYASVSHGKGCVLGDDMGLGKTVQLISLIAALLKKTGTGLDGLAIKKHQAKVVKDLRAREEKKRQALLDGFGIQDDAAGDDEVERPPFSPILIVVPASVVDNWQNEFETWGHFDVGVYRGSNREKALERIKDGRDSILVTGKSLFTRAGDWDAIATVGWSLCIVDEFHEFKNGKSQGYMRLADLRDNSGCPVIGMTGTLMQNNHDELYYLMDLVRPGLLGDRSDFTNEISKPLMYARAKDSKEVVNTVAEQRENLLRNLIKPAYLERKKEDVLKDNLTQKREKVIFCELSEIQKKVYRHILSLPDFQLLRFANAPCDCGVNKQYFRAYKKLKTHKEQIAFQRRHKDELIPQKQCCWRYPWNPNRGMPGEPDIDPDASLWCMNHEKPIGNPDEIGEDLIDGKYIVCQNCPTCLILSAMHKLYKIASHPALLQVDPTESGPEAKRKLDFAKVALTPDFLRELPGGTYYKSDGIMDDHIKLSGKMKTLDYLLKRYLRRNNRVLLFSYSTASLDVIQNHVKTQGWTHLRLDGSTPTSQRQALVDKYQQGQAQIFLISTKAGGLGLNLTEANKVIIFDVNWNPSYDEQAQDRAYRIGQKRDVDTVRLVARGTIEELMYARQVYKVQLKKQTLGHTTDGKNQPKIFRGVAKDTNRKGELFGVENLLKFKDGSFMASLWKKADDARQEHDMNDLAKELENVGEDQLEEAAEEGDEGPKDNRPRPQKKQKQQQSGDESESDDDNIGDMDHNHIFSETKGGAVVKADDSDADEELGGASQIVEVTTKLAIENLDSDDDDDEPTPPDYEPHVKSEVKKEAGSAPKTTVKAEKSSATAAATAPPSAENSAKASGGKSNTADSTPNSMEGPRTQPRTQDGDDSDDDKTASLAPEPVKSSAVGGGGAKEDSAGKGEPSSDKPAKDTEEQTEKVSPDRSVGDQSSGSPGGLKTQPTTQPPSERAQKKGAATAKVMLMGTLFETQKKKKDAPAKKKSGGLYIPSYSKK